MISSNQIDHHMTEKGEIKWTNIKRRFGYITSSSGKDIYVSLSKVNRKTEFRGLYPKDSVTFDIGKDAKDREQALNVTVISREKNVKKDNPKASDRQKAVTAEPAKETRSRKPRQRKSENAKASDAPDAKPSTENQAEDAKTKAKKRRTKKHGRQAITEMSAEVVDSNPYRFVMSACY
jgi:cold shock CspA family protein